MAVLESVFLKILAAALSYGYWVIFLIMFPEYILISCILPYIYLVRCVLVLRCGLAGLVWCGIRVQTEVSDIKLVSLFIRLAR